ncbi:MAG: 6-carboxytetrahydropterin synthase [Verrucomicrobiales bacterium]
MSEPHDIILRFSRRYSMAHRLTSGAAPNCCVPHGHDEIVTVDITRASCSELDPATNMLVEFDQAKGRWFEWIDHCVDHTFHIGDNDPLISYFREHEPALIPKLLITPGDPTTELRAACYFAKLSAFLNAGAEDLICTCIRIRETPTNTVEFKTSQISSYLPEEAGNWWHRADLSINDLNC